MVTPLTLVLTLHRVLSLDLTDEGETQQSGLEGGGVRTEEKWRLPGSFGGCGSVAGEVAAPNLQVAASHPAPT